MAKRCIGIDISPLYLRVVQILRTGRDFRIEKLFSAQPRRATDSLPDIFRSLFSEYGFDRRAPIAISVPYDTVYFRNLQTDAAGLEQLRQQSSKALEFSFPIQPDQLIAQVCSYHPLSDDKYSVLTVAADRASLHQRLNVLADSKIHPELAEAPVFAIHSAVALNHPEITTGSAVIVFLDESHLTLLVTRGKNILSVRNIPIAFSDNDNTGSIQEQIAEIVCREAQITWQKVFGAPIEPDTGIYLLATDANGEYLKSLIEQNLDCWTTIVDLSAVVQTPSDNDDKAALSACVAEGLALQLLAPEQTTGLNFLEADNTDTKSPLNVKKEIATYAALAGAVVILLLVGLFVQLSRLEADYADIKSEIRQTFQTALPDEKNIVNPLAQLEQKLDSFRGDYQLFASFSPTALGPLQILRHISANTPPQTDLKVDDLLIAADTVRITGTCDSFESVYEWQQRLRQVPGFTLVEVRDVQKNPKTDLVQFSILISSAAKEQK